MNKHAVGYRPRDGTPPASHPTREAGRTNPRMMRDKRKEDDDAKQAGYLSSVLRGSADENLSEGVAGAPGSCRCRFA